MKMSRFTYTVIVISVTIVLLTLGFYLGFSNMRKNNSKGNSENIVNENKPSASNTSTMPVNEQPVEPVNTEPVTDIEIIYTDYYIKCNHVVEDKINAYGAKISEVIKEHDDNMSKKEYLLTEQTDKKVVFTKKHDSYCDEHYLVKIDNGKVVVYNNVNDGVYPLYKETNISEEKLRDSLKAELKKGIFVNTKKELYSLLEDAES